MEIQRFAFSSIFKVTVMAMLFLSVALKRVRTLQKMARQICFNVQQKFDIFREFHEQVEKRYLSRTTASLMYFAKFRMGRRTKKWDGTQKKMEGSFKTWL